MKKYLLLFFLLLSILNIGYSQVGIGTITPSDASILDVNGTVDGGVTYGGLMPPRIPTETERATINPQVADAGLLIFLQRTGCLQLWTGSNWRDIFCSSTVVDFTEPTQTLFEGVGGIDFQFNIEDPSLTEPITFFITASSFDDLDESTGVTITIPAGVSTFTATDVFTITDDAIQETAEDVLFTISNLTGGQGEISIGDINPQTVTIIDNDTQVFDAWINEFHYDNSGVDTNQFVELAGIIGANFSYRITLYNGSGSPYRAWGGTNNDLINDNGNGYGFLIRTIPSNGNFENGSGAIALSLNGTLVQFISYGGSPITATTAATFISNDAAGMTTTEDIGIQQTGDSTLDPAGASLQLTGPGRTYGDFTWIRTQMSTQLSENTGQTISN